ncbi:MAG: ParB/RepB/Spo0J family partition protein [Candidatus Eremiobacterota bacterium]
MSKKGLGKGLGAIFSQVDITSSEEEGIAQINIDEITPNPYQPRKDFDEEELQNLANSIKEHGLIQPVVVVKEGDLYNLVVGERRLRAAQKAGLSEIPALIKKKEEVRLLEMAIVENIQRENLNPLEEAEAFGQLAEEFDLTQEQLAVKVGKNRSTVANILRLLHLPAEIKECLRKGLISSGHARAILMLDRKDAQILFCEKIIKEGLSVRQAEELAGKNDREKKKKISKVYKTVEVMDIQENLQKVFGTKVEIKHREKVNKGKIEISYYSLDDLNRLLDMMATLASDVKLEDLL